MLVRATTAMERVFIVDRDRARRAQLRSRLIDLDLEVQAVARLDESTPDARAAVGLFHVHAMLGEESPDAAADAAVAYSTDPGDDRLAAAAFDRGAQVFLPSDEFSTVERVVAARLRSLALTRRLGERRAVALLENRSLRGAAGTASEVAARRARRGEGVLLIDTRLRVAYIGGGVAALFGRDVLGRSLDEVFPSSDLDLQVFTTPCAAREGVRVDLPPGADGTPGRSLAVAIRPLDGDAGWLLLLRHVGSGAGTDAAFPMPAAPVPASEALALTEAATRVFRLDPTRYLDSPTGDVRRAFPALVAAQDPVLVRGEVGTGRAHVARALHYQGAPGRVLVEVGCRGRNPAALEADLFGARGGESGVAGGLVRSAAGGTLLVRDVDRLSRNAQDFLRAATSAPDGPDGPGGPDEPRLIATTACLEPGLSRRLGANVLELSSLRERPDRLEFLVRTLARRCGATEVCAEALEALAKRAWPGNLVELADVVSRAARAARAAGGERLAPDDLPTGDAAPAHLPGEGVVLDEPGGACPPWVVTDEDPVRFDVYERKAILRALHQCSGDRVAAAKLLGIGKSTIYRKIAELGLDDPPPRANG